MKRKTLLVLLILLLFFVNLGIIFFKARPKPQSFYLIEEGQIITEPATPSPKAFPNAKIMERKVRSGNRGYIILNKVNVHFGIWKTIREEVLGN